MIENWCEHVMELIKEKKTDELLKLVYTVTYTNWGCNAHGNISECGITKEEFLYSFKPFHRGTNTLAFEYLKHSTRIVLDIDMPDPSLSDNEIVFKYFAAQEAK